MRSRRDLSPTVRNLRWGFRLIGLLLAVFGVVYTWASWESDKREASSFLVSIAELGGKSLNTHFHGYEDALRELAREARDERLVNDPDRARAVLRRFQAAHPRLRHVNLVTAEGQVLATSSPLVAGPLPHLGNSPSFIAGASAIRNGRGFTLGPPTVSRIDNEWIIPLGYGIKDHEGRLLFIVYGALPMSEQQAFWQGLDLPKDTAFGLMRDDGRLMSRYPEPANVDRQKVYGVPRDGALIRHLRKAGYPERGVIRGDANLNGSDNVFAFHRLANYPVTFFVATPASNLWAVWWNQARFTYLLMGVLLAGSAAIYLWMRSRQIAWEHEREQSESSARLAASAMANTIEGIIITDAAGNIVSVNQAFTAITGYASEEVVGRKPSVLASGHHGELFYADMWKTLSEDGHWQGEVWDRRKNGEMYAELLSISAVRSPRGEITHYVGVFNDISQYKDYEARLEHLANHDALTGLPNRVLLNDRIEEALARARRSNGMVCVMFIDLDHFKHVNDSLGHAIGDRLLKEVAARLQSCVRESDTVARLGGDEFTIVLECLGHPDEASLVVRKLHDALAQPVAIDEHQLYVSTSIGISFFPQDGQDAATLLQHADTAMYRAKEEGRDRHKFYASDMNQRAQEFITMANSLHAALDRGEFFLEYQPRVDLDGGGIVGAEALVRWQHPELGRIPPDKFIPLAEETGLINGIGDWVLRTACTQGRRWHDAGFPVRIGVNLSARQFRKQDFVERLLAVLAQTGFPAAMLDLEITESLMMHDPDSARRILDRLSALGLTIALDDFGTGYSSLSYLKQFPIDCVKIDRSFIRDIPGDADSTAIVKTIIAMARNLRLSLIAEGVETAEQCAHLRAEGCDEAQGYFFSRPLSAPDLEDMLRRGETLAAAGERVL